MNRSVRSAALFGLLAGLATVAVAEAVRPRGGSGLLVDWEEVRKRARTWLASSSTPPVELGAAERQYRLMAAQLQAPLLKFVGPLPKGAAMPEFSALDRGAWLDLNLTILRRVVDPILEKGRMPNSLVVEAGRAGLNHYVAFLLAFLGRRVLGQYDPQLLGTEPLSADGLYLVETNVEEWGRKAELPGEDLRRWLILHEMTHAWQFAAHPWLKDYMESSVRVLLESVTKAGPPAARVAAFAGVLPAQWRVMRQMQGTMSFIEGYSNLVMNELGSRTLAAFEQLEDAYRARGQSRSMIEILIWRLTGLDLKLQQYQKGEAFARAVYHAHGMDVLNRAWDGAEAMPNLDELADHERWYRRVVLAETRR
ncbi:MAG TPA: zinc-dependent metalloprotease [Candidatus Dormibacteraeota bacterium]|nr:zinc-dependent metalloprotease [Candidatus Dormibacteraeota bacterium]